MTYAELQQRGQNYKNEDRTATAPLPMKLLTDCSDIRALSDYFSRPFHTIGKRRARSAMLIPFDHIMGSMQFSDGMAIRN